MKICAVIVNYNDSNNTLKLVKSLSEYKILDKVIVVDNKSNEDDYYKLTCYKSSKYLLLRNTENMGYGEGNNIGILKAEKIGSTLCLIVNPDVEISENSIIKMVDTFRRNRQALIVAPSTTVNGIRVAWRVRGMLDLVFSQLKIISKIMKASFYSSNYYDDKTSTKVDAVLGACLMINIIKFKKIGMYDRNMFLYEEENYLALQCQRYNFDTILLCNDYYIHNHKSDNLKNLRQQIYTKRLMHKSLLYLTKNYCHYGNFKLFITKIVLFLSIFEVILSFSIRNVTSLVFKRK